MISMPLHFPELSLDELDCCATDKKALVQWLLDLPLAHPMASQEKLAGLLDQLNRLKLAAPRRLEWLSEIRPLVDQVCHELDQGLHAAGEDQAAQDLADLLAQGYKRCVHDLLEQRAQLPAPVLARSLSQALYQAILRLSHLVLRACKQHLIAPDRCWEELHYLYFIARRSRLHDKPLAEQAPQTCQQAYYQALLLVLVHGEQIRRDELDQVFAWLAEWSGLIEECAPNAHLAQFEVLKEHHYFPRRRQGLDLHPTGEDLGFSTRQIARQLQQALDGGDPPLSNRLTQHLLALLDDSADRAAPRIESEQPLTLVLGMLAAHFHMNGRRSLDSLVSDNPQYKSERENPFLKEAEKKADPWSGAFDAEDRAHEASEDSTKPVEFESFTLASAQIDLSERFPLFTLRQLNTSSTGYCLYWPGDAPDQLRTGELVAVREHDSDLWHGGVIRWVREAQGGHQLGVELLASRLEPCAIRPVITVGDEAPFRPGFLIPAIDVFRVPPGLIAPLLPFREGQKVEILDGEQRRLAKLAELVSTPGEFSQFRLEWIG